MKNKINYLKGDATDPKQVDDKISVIMHVCNDIGKWGAGFVMALSKKWSEPEKAYREWYVKRIKRNKVPGMVQQELLGVSNIVPVEQGDHSIEVMNIIGQHKVREEGYVPVRYWAIHEAMKNFVKWEDPAERSVHMPRIGCGLAGGNWEEIEYIINETLIAAGFEVFVYDFEPK